MSNMVQFEITPLPFLTRETPRSTFFPGQDMRSGQTSPGEVPEKKVEKTTAERCVKSRKHTRVTWGSPRGQPTRRRVKGTQKKKVEKRWKIFPSAVEQKSLIIVVVVEIKLGQT
jgi:hypothetical protein